jgi:hypothetical protein
MADAKVHVSAIEGGYSVDVIGRYLAGVSEQHNSPNFV